MIDAPSHSDMGIISTINSDPLSPSAVVAGTFQLGEPAAYIYFHLQLFSPIGDFICNRLEKISFICKQILACVYPRFLSTHDMISQCLSYSEHVFYFTEKLSFPELQPHFL
jgi:hypothetical protein